MSQNEVSTKVNTLRELRRMAAELEDEITSLEDSIKAEMTTRGTDTIDGTDYKITWKAVPGNRIDAKALRAELPEIAQRYTVATMTRRFIVA
jgi:predicted phage-related endonuclease